MATLGQVMVEVGADVSSFEKSMKDVEKGLRNTGKKLGNTSTKIGETIKNNFNFNKDLKDLPDSLKPFANSLQETSAEISELSKQGVQDLDKLKDMVIKNRVGFKQMYDQTASGKKALKMIQDMNEETNKTRMAVLGFNRDGKLKISAEESNKQLKLFNSYVKDTQKELEALRDAGDLGSFEAGMDSLNKNIQEVQNTMKATTKGTKGYMSELKKLGIITSDMGNKTAIAMERMRDSFIMANDKMMAMKGPTTKIRENLERMDVRKLDQQFLGVAKRLGDVAKQGRITNTAINELGRNASMKDLANQIQIINAGITNYQALQMGMLIGMGAWTFGMVKLSNIVDGRLIPAAETFKSTWIDALEEIGKAWTTMVLPVIEFGTAIGKAFNSFSEANPILAGMIGNIAFLTGLFSLLLSPLAIGISRAGSFAVAFNLLWMTIAPFVTGLLTVIGTCLILATTFVTVANAINQMWKKSEAFRGAVVNMWESIKTAVMDAIKPMLFNLDMLKGAFFAFLGTMLGGVYTFEGGWRNIGDTVAKVITLITPLISSVLGNAFTILNNIAVPIIQTLIKYFNILTVYWAENGDMIVATLVLVGQMVMTAFTTIHGFIQSIMPVILTIITVAFSIIRDVAQEVFPKILAIVQLVFPMIAAIISAVMPIVLGIIVSIWGNIKAVITGTLNFVLNFLLFFKNLFAGNWSGMWTNIKVMTSSFFSVLWNLFNLMFFGKIVKGFLAFGKAVLSGTRATWSAFKTAVSSAITNTKDTAIRTISNMKTSLISIFKAVWNGTINIVQGMKAGLSVIWNSIKTVAKTAFDGVKKSIMDPIKKAKEEVLKIIQAIKDAFGKMKITVPKPKLPKVSVGKKKDAVFGFDMPTFKVTWNAKGNILKQPTYIGGGHAGGEAGAEAVLPLGRKRYFGPWAKMVSELLTDNLDGGVGGAGAVVNKFEIAQLVVREEADIDRIAAALEKKQRVQSRAKGQLVY